MHNGLMAEESVTERPSTSSSLMRKTKMDLPNRNSPEEGGKSGTSAPHHRSNSSRGTTKNSSSRNLSSGKKMTSASVISKNCKRFSHIFHCSSSEDSTSSSDTILDQQQQQSNGLLTNNAIKEYTTISSISYATSSNHTSSTITTILQSSRQYSKNKNEPNAISSSAISGAKPETKKAVLTDHRISYLLGSPASPASNNAVLNSTSPANSRFQSNQVQFKHEINSVATTEPVSNTINNNSTGRHSSIAMFHRAWEDVKVKKEPEEKRTEHLDFDKSNGLEVEVHSELMEGMINDEDEDVTVKQETEETASSCSSSADADNEAEIDEPKARDKKRRSVDNMSKESKELLLQLTESEKRKSSRLVSKTTFCSKKHDAQVMKRLKQIIKKSPDDLTSEERQIQDAFPQLVHTVKKRLETRKLASERLKEIEDSPDELEIKCTKLAQVIKNAKYLVFYTGAGISTTSGIPDYRGPNGIWTLLRNGQSLDSQTPAMLTTADPTLTHMAIKTLHSQSIIKHIVSQNCDGLHLRSGIPKSALSEVHGNMYIEVCTRCNREYVRTFDVTEHTRRYEHRTGRHCYHCGSYLKDTVVHFGERGKLRWPLNWAGAEYHVARADVILCMGSSLKVLRRYPWLWGMDLPVNKRPKLFIVNLQWTPKDQFAKLKIHGKCDEVMQTVMSKLNIPIPKYERESDQIFAVATSLHESEIHSRSSIEMEFPQNKSYPTDPHDINNYIRFEPKFRIPISDLKMKAEEDYISDKEEKMDDDDPTKVRKRTLRSQTLKNKKGSGDRNDGKKKLTKKRDRSIIIKGNGNGWFGNAWGVKPKKRKTSVSKT